MNRLTKSGDESPHSENGANLRNIHKRGCGRVRHAGIGADCINFPSGKPEIISRYRSTQEPFPCLGCRSLFPSWAIRSRLDDTLVSVLENRPANCEILVVHNEPYNDPYELAGEVQFLKARPRAGFVECLNLGLSAGRAPVVNAIACGVEVCAGWADAACGTSAILTWRPWRPSSCIAPTAGRSFPPALGYRAEGIVVKRIGPGATAEPRLPRSGRVLRTRHPGRFYRTSAVKAVGGFSSWTTPTLATIDMAHVASARRIPLRDGARVRGLRGRCRGARASRVFGTAATPSGSSGAGHRAWPPPLDRRPCRAGGRRMRHRPVASRDAFQLIGRAGGAIHTALASAPPSAAAIGQRRGSIGLSHRRIFLAVGRWDDRQSARAT